MDVIAIIADNCRNLGIGLLVFSTSLIIQAVVTFNQDQAMTIKNQTRFIERFCCIACCLFVAGSFSILFGILMYVYMKLPGGNWIAIGYTLFIVAGNFVVWSNKLKSTDYKEFGRKKKTTAWAILYVAIFLLVIYMVLTMLVALGLIS